MVEAEVRSRYFGELATRYTKRKQMISGTSFFLSSGAAATLAAEVTREIPLALSVVAALIGAYSIAVGLDKKAATMAKLHAAWNQLSSDYENLWNHWFEDDAESKLTMLVTRGKDASETGTSEAPYDERLLAKWRDQVYSRYGPTTA